MLNKSQNVDLTLYSAQVLLDNSSFFVDLPDPQGRLRFVVYLIENMVTSECEKIIQSHLTNFSHFSIPMNIDQTDILSSVGMEPVQNWNENIQMSCDVL